MRPQIDGKMVCKYTLNKDLESRLGGCFFLYDSKLIYIGEITPQNHLVIYDPVSLTVLTKIKPDDPLFDMSSIELGYFNFQHKTLGNKALYSIRYPFKRWRQGVCQNNTNILEIDGESLSCGGFSSPNGNHTLHTEGFRDAVEGRFPLLDPFLIAGEGELAITPDIAVKKTRSGVVLVFYKMREAGFIVPKTKTVNIPNTSVTDIVMKQLSTYDWNVEVLNG